MQVVMKSLRQLLNQLRLQRAIGEMMPSYGTAAPVGRIARLRRLETPFHWAEKRHLFTLLWQQTPQQNGFRFTVHQLVRQKGSQPQDRCALSVRLSVCVSHANIYEFPKPRATIFFWAETQH